MVDSADSCTRFLVQILFGTVKIHTTFFVIRRRVTVQRSCYCGGGHLFIIRDGSLTTKFPVLCFFTLFWTISFSEFVAFVILIEGIPGSTCPYLKALAFCRSITIIATFIFFRSPSPLSVQNVLSECLFILETRIFNVMFAHQFPSLAPPET